MTALRSLLWITSLVATQSTFAQQPIQFDGFVSIGYVDPESNQFLGSEDGEAAILTENVLRMTVPFENGLALSGQFLYREFGDNFDGGLRLDFLQLDYRSQWWGEGQQTASLGRFKARQGLYNETRDVPMTRPSILLPQSVYLDIARNFFLTLDGAKLNSLFPFERGDLSVELAVGRNQFDDKFSSMALGETAEGDWSSETNYYFDVRYESKSWTTAFNTSWIDVNYSPHSGAFLPILINDQPFALETTNGAFNSVMTTFSLQYTFTPVEFTYERNQREFETTGFYPGVTSSKSTMGGQYLQARYFFNEDWTILARFDEFFINTDDKQGELLSQTGNSRGYARSYDRTLGVNWRINQHWYLSFEQHWVTGGSWLPPIGKGRQLPPLNDDWKMTAFQLSYHF
jgi:hypothetical protein